MINNIINNFKYIYLNALGVNVGNSNDKEEFRGYEERECGQLRTCR